MARSPAAIALLIKRWRQSQEPTILRALGLSRLAEAFDFLIDVIQNGELPSSKAALEALKPHLDAGDLRTRVDRALAETHRSSD